MASVNWTMISETGRPVPLPKEVDLLTIHNGQVSLVPDWKAPKQVATGTVTLTNQRAIFVADLDTAYSPPFESISIPLTAILETSFVQPFFSQNYLSISVASALEGGFPEGTQLEMRFIDRKMFDFVSRLEQARTLALRQKREARIEEPLPLYPAPSPAAAPTTTHSGEGPILAAEQDAARPPAYDAA